MSSRSLEWTKSQLYLSKHICDRRRVNSWNAFLKAKLHEANAGKSVENPALSIDHCHYTGCEVGTRYKLMEFIAKNKGELLKAYCGLTLAEKQAYNGSIIAARATKVCVIHSNPTSVVHAVSSAFLSRIDWFSLSPMRGF